jgi:hypothetical protein
MARESALTAVLDAPAFLCHPARMPDPIFRKSLP